MGDAVADIAVSNPGLSAHFASYAGLPSLRFDWQGCEKTAYLAYPIVQRSQGQTVSDRGLAEVGDQKRSPSAAFRLSTRRAAGVPRPKSHGPLTDARVLILDCNVRFFVLNHVDPFASIPRFVKLICLVYIKVCKPTIS